MDGWWTQEDDEEPYVGEGHFIPPCYSAALQTPQRHQPLLRALQAARAPRPWRPCASRIVQLSPDWYLEPEPCGPGYEKQILLGWISIENHQVRHQHPAHAARRTHLPSPGFPSARRKLCCVSSPLFAGGPVVTVTDPGGCCRSCPGTNLESSGCDSWNHSKLPGLNSGWQPRNFCNATRCRLGPLTP